MDRRRLLRGAVATGVLAFGMCVAPLVEPAAPADARPPATRRKQKAKVPVVPRTGTTLTPFGRKERRGGTLLVVVAHEDDAILFMNPDVAAAINAGLCVRTIYVTAGDDGRGTAYWQQRERGPGASYATMCGLPDDWAPRAATLDHHPVTEYLLAGQPKVSLVSLRLPDGNLAGQGFAATQYQSLQKLRVGQLAQLTSVDGAASYTEAELVRAVGALVQLDEPTMLYTQAFSATLSPDDHADHQAVGYFTALARQTYGPRVPLTRYLGYQVNAMPPDLSGDEVTQKQAIFDAYEQEDTVICTATNDCDGQASYDTYMSREYLQTTPIGKLG